MGLFGVHLVPTRIIGGWKGQHAETVDASEEPSCLAGFPGATSDILRSSCRLFRFGRTANCLERS